jgi:hypothetical protein
VSALPLIVGELNPYSESDQFALFPRPRKASGYRLATKIMGLTEMEYLRAYDRANLCHGKFSVRAAHDAAQWHWIHGKYNRFILLGAKVSKAFGFEFDPFTKKILGGKVFVMLPHPSGLCRIWNEVDSIDRARLVLIEAGMLKNNGYRPDPV